MYKGDVIHIRVVRREWRSESSDWGDFRSLWRTLGICRSENGLVSVRNWKRGEFYLLSCASASRRFCGKSRGFTTL